MISLTFLQLSDLHLGRPFAWLPESLRAERRADQRELLWRAVEVAIERRLDAIVIAGDLFDGEAVDRETIARAVECVSQAGCPPVFIAPGNHDCFSRSTFYYDNRRLVAAGQAPWPEHVVVFGTPEIRGVPVPGRHDVVVWGRCVHENVPSTERVLDTRPSLDPGRLHLLAFHGSRDGSLPPGKRLTAPFDDAELLAWGADYAALGHYHAPAQVQDERGVVRASYSGSPVALAIDETGPRSVQIVRVERRAGDPTGATRRVEIETLELDRRRLHRLDVPLAGVGSPESLRARMGDVLDAESVRPQDLAILRLVGRYRPGIALSARVEDFPGRCFHLHIDASGMRPDYDLDAYRRVDPRTTEERFVRSLLADLDAESDPARRRTIESALYYGLDALRLGDVAPRYEPMGCGPA